MKKALAFLVVLLLVVLPLASCNDVQGVPDEPNVPVAENVVIASSEGTQYSVLLGSDLVSGQKIEIKTMVDSLKNDFGIEMEIRLPSREEGDQPPEAYEIVVGRASRTESDAAYGKLRYGEYSVSYNAATKRITVVGSSNELSLEAFKYLFDTYFDKSTGTLSIPGDLSYHFTVDYPYDSITINGVDVREYTIIVPSFDDIYSYYTAQSISDYFMYKTGYGIDIAEDERDESRYEILIGDTSRDEDDLACPPEIGEYAVALVGDKLVLRGYGIYVGAGFGETVAPVLDGGGTRTPSVDNLPTSLALKKYSSPESADSVVLMIGDGMGPNHIEAALLGGLDTFVPESFTSIGHAVTRSLSVMRGKAEATDSAASATAMATGTKTVNGYIGKDESGKDLVNVREIAAESGAKTAVITTDAITGATPSAFLVHNIARTNTDEIKEDILELVASGGIDYCHGSASDFLTVRIREALGTIAYTDAPFFMMVEEGKIDTYSHSNDLSGAIKALTRFNDAVTYVACFVMARGDTALIVTADHETGGLIVDAEAEAGYAYTTENHTNVDVGLFAIGGGTDIFDGVRTENTDIAKFMTAHFVSE